MSASMLCMLRRSFDIKRVCRLSHRINQLSTTRNLLDENDFTTSKDSMKQRLDAQSEEALRKAFDIFDKVIQTDTSTEAKEDPRDAYSFSKLLRESPFVGIGNPEGRIVIGTIFEIVNDDMYIDFGGKFHCVCFKPQSRQYHVGAKVRVKLIDLELSARFIGAERDNTLLEADAMLLGLYYT